MNIELYSDFLLDNARKVPDKMAVIASDASYTYAQLNRKANCFANGLLAKGVRCGDRVMLALPKDSKAFVAMFGIMKIGAVLVPVSTAYPEGRLQKIREDSESVMMIGTPDGIGEVMFDDVLQSGEGDDFEPARPPIDGSAPCMILYTSGSTGNPKGVMLRHQGFVTTGLPLEDNLLSWNTHLYGHTFLGVTTITFAFFYMEYCFCLSNACTYVMADLEHSRSPMLMAEDMKKYSVDVVSGTPSRIMQYLDIPVYAEAFRNVHVLVIGGERVPAGMPEAVHAIAPDCVILNGYSQTEGNGPMIVAVVETADSRGYACHGWDMIVVDDNLQTPPAGEPGELLMTGPNMMKEYVNLPEEMAARTVEVNGVPYFRTGDLVRHFEDGGYLIVGRKDQQIKLRGLRMEPGEIEKVIQAFPGIRIEKAVAKVNVIHNTEHLVSYYTGAGEANEAELRKHLAYQLPDYMIPDYFLYLEKFPLNQNGKIDYKLLPEITIEQSEIVPPRDELERGLLEECRRIVEYDEFGVTSRLEEVGFTSLKYIELASLIIDRTGYEMRLTDLMSGGHTVRSLADRIRGSAGLKQSRKQGKIRLEKYPLTPQLYQFMTANPSSEMYRKFVFSDRWTDAAVIRDTFVNVLNAYPYLYTTFRKEGDTWFQIPGNGITLRTEDVSILEGEPSEEEIAAFCVPYDLKSATRLFDLKVYQGEKVTVLFHIQHALMDHVFMEKFLSQIRAVLCGAGIQSMETTDYFDYTMETTAAEQEAEAEALTKRKVYPEYNVTLRKTPQIVSKPALVQGAIAMGKMDPVLSKYRIQAAAYLFGLAGQAYLKVMGQNRAVVQNMFGGRNDARLFNTAGYFPTRMPVMIQADPHFYEHVAQSNLQAIQALKPQDDWGYRGLARGEYAWPSVIFNCLDYIEPNEDFEMVSLIQGQNAPSRESMSVTPQVWFDCFVFPEKGAAINLNYDPEFLSEEKAREIIDTMKNLAEEAVKS